MLDLNRAFTDSALQFNSSLESSILSATQQTNSSSYPSFAEALASVQADSIQSQNETFDSTAMVQQFQGESSWRATTSNDQFDNGSSNSSYDASEISQPQKTTSTKSTSESTQSTEDVYVQGRSTDRHSASVQNIDPASQDESSTSSPTTGKSTEKSKHGKETDSVGGAATVSENAQANANPTNDGGATLAGQSAADSMANSPLLVAAQGAESAPTIAAKTRSSKASDSSSDLAFAVKIQGNDSAVDSSPPSTNAGSAQADPAGQASSSEFAAQLGTMMSSLGQKNPGNPGSSGGDAAPGLASLPISGSQSPSESFTDAASETSQEEVSKAADVPEDQIPNTQPLKTVQVQITGADNQRVDLRLTERSGALTMSVRSADGTLTKALQQNLPELAGRLNDQQIRAEWWKPDVQQTESSQKPGNSPNSGSNNNSSTQDQGSQGKGSSGQQGGRGTRQPDWVEELSDLRKSTQNGTQYSWHL